MIRRFLSRWIGIGPLRFSGKVQTKIESTATITAPANAISYIGVPTLGDTSPPTAYTLLSLAEKSALHIDSASIGRGSHLKVSPGATLKIGKETYCADDCRISCAQEISIGAFCAISWEVQIFDDHGHAFENKSRKEPIRIGDNVWIGARAIILPGADIGSGSVVGAGAVVKGKFPPKSLIAGVPARVIREGVNWER